jgi:twitching motility protein PilT
VSNRAGKIEHLLETLWERKGTDLLLTPGAPPILRIDGELVRLESAPLTADETTTLIRSTFTPEIDEQFARNKEVDYSFAWRDRARFRANAFTQRGSISLALRLIPYEIPTLGDLGLPPAVDAFCELHQGLILVTGATGSGKSTTLAAMIDRINERRACHIVTIEDPIEYVHHHKRSAVNQREVGEDALSFERALRSALREDPDVVLVGEMRDLETIGTALTIAETGHLVLATLHTNDAAQTIDRVVDVFPAERQQQIRVQVASTLAGVVHQRLVPRIGGGRVGAFEVVVATTPIRNLIKEGKSRQIRNVVATGQREGMVTLEASLSALVSKGLITHDDAVARSLHPNEVAGGPRARR